MPLLPNAANFGQFVRCFPAAPVSRTVARVERSCDRHERAVLLAVRDSTAAEGWERPAAHSAPRQVVVKCPHVVCVVFDLQRGTPKDATGYREISSVVV
jgi:hypothetical protein